MQAEQGTAVPYLVAHGYIADSTLYFIATQLMGPSLESIPAPSDDMVQFWEGGVLAVVDKVHARGVMLNDIRPDNFLTGGPYGVMAVDFAFAKLGVDRKNLVSERNEAGRMLREMLRRKGNGHTAKGPITRAQLYVRAHKCSQVASVKGVWRVM